MDDEERSAVAAWNLMGGLEHSAIPLEVAAELVGVRNIELFIRRLVAIRAHMNKPTEQ